MNKISNLLHLIDDTCRTHFDYHYHKPYQTILLLETYLDAHQYHLGKANQDDTGK